MSPLDRLRGALADGSATLGSLVTMGDLSENLGVAGQFDHPRLREVVAKAEATILAGVPSPSAASRSLPTRRAR